MRKVAVIAVFIYFSQGAVAQQPEVPKQASSEPGAIALSQLPDVPVQTVPAQPPQLEPSIQAASDAQPHAVTNQTTPKPIPPSSSAQPSQHFPLSIPLVTLSDKDYFSINFAFNTADEASSPSTLIDSTSGTGMVKANLETESAWTLGAEFGHLKPYGLGYNIGLSFDTARDANKLVLTGSNGVTTTSGFEGGENFNVTSFYWSPVYTFIGSYVYCGYMHPKSWFQLQMRHTSLLAFFLLQRKA